jgi:hypothetical protein
LAKSAKFKLCLISLVSPHAVQEAERADLARVALTFGQLSDNYLKHIKANGKLSWKADERYLKRLKAKFGKRAAALIAKREFMDFLEAAAKKSKTSANRMQSTAPNRQIRTAPRGTAAV